MGLMFKMLVVKANELEDLKCNVCMYRNECSGQTTSGNGGDPIFPPCCDKDFEYLIDVDGAMDYFNKEKAI